MARKKQAATGAPGWIVTFADLLASVLAFFVILAAYSTMDKQKLQVVAGSMNEAFGTVRENRLSGIMELNGIPTKTHLRNAKPRPIEEASDITAPHEFKKPTDEKNLVTEERNFTQAAMSLRQALNDMPEIAEVSKNIIIEETKEGLNLSLVDQDGRSMFAEGSVNPFERTRRVLQAIVPTINRLPNRIVISGHTSSVRPGQRVTEPAWEMSMGRAASVREILAASGVAGNRFAAVTGKADTDPILPDNPYLAPNRRVTMTLLYEAPALPTGLRP